MSLLRRVEVRTRRGGARNVGKARGHETSPPAVERIDARPTRGVHDRAVRRRMETRSALHAGRNAVPRTPLRGERWRRRGQHARLVRSADCDAYYESGRFFSRNGGLQATRNVSTRVSGLGTPSLPDHVRPAATFLFPRVRLKTHTNGKTHDSGKKLRNGGLFRRSQRLRRGSETRTTISTEAKVRSSVRLRSLRRRSRISAPRRDDSASRLGAVAPRSSRGAPRC